MVEKGKQMVEKCKQAAEKRKPAADEVKEEEECKQTADGPKEECKQTAVKYYKPEDGFYTPNQSPILERSKQTADIDKIEVVAEINSPSKQTAEINATAGQNDQKSSVWTWAKKGGKAASSFSQSVLTKVLADQVTSTLQF